MMAKSSEDLALEGLALLSARLGADPTLTQGPGGNTSIKLGDRLWVKASGTWLADALKRPIFVPLDLSGVLRRLDAGEPDPASPEVCSVGDSAGLRPSIETTLHAVMPQRVVLHLHCVDTIAHAVRTDGSQVLARTLNGLRWAWIPYAKPGVPLTRALRAAAEGGANVLILANHGLVVAADDVENAASLLYEVVTRLRVPPRQAPKADHAVLEEMTRIGGYRLPHFEEAHAAGTDPQNLAVATGGALYPDHVVFLGRSPLLALTADQAGTRIVELRNRGKSGPALLIISGTGVLLRSDLGRSAEEMARCLGLVLSRIDPNAPIVFLTADQETELLGWEAEKHRQALDLAHDRV